MRRDAFFTSRTRKESYVKAAGDGLSVLLDAFNITLLAGEPAQLGRVDCASSGITRWHLFDLAIDPGVAMALEGPASEVTCGSVDELTGTEA